MTTATETTETTNTIAPATAAQKRALTDEETGLLFDKLLERSDLYERMSIAIGLAKHGLPKESGHVEMTFRDKAGEPLALMMVVLDPDLIWRVEAFAKTLNDDEATDLAPSDD